MKSVYNLNKLADKFERKLYKYAQKMNTITPNQVGPILNKSNLWGGIPFDPNGPAADIIFNTMNKVGFQGKFDANLTIDPKYGVKITLISDNPKTASLQAALQNYFGPRMSQALKQSKIPAPEGPLDVPWLAGVANVA